MSPLPVGEKNRSSLISLDGVTLFSAGSSHLHPKDVQNVTRIFSKFINMVSTQFKTKILSFRIDHGSEFTNNQITKLFEDKGINPISTTAIDSRAKDVAECFNFNSFK